MVEEKFCQGCTQKSRCQEVYEHISKIQGPSVVFRVFIAFLLPMLVFIGCLSAFERILAEVTNSKGAQTVIGFLLALTASFICILITKAISHRQGF
jgi:Fe2+ transport system protein B